MVGDFIKRSVGLGWLPGVILAWPLLAGAQVPVDDDGNPLADAAPVAEEIPLLSAAELEELVGPIALYPDDLLAIVLPASTYPLQLIQAERFLQELEHDPSLKPDEAWDDSIVALLNYPEVVELMAEDLDKTWRLGEAVVAQQADVIAAIETFRDRAYAAGNLKSDERQTVSESEGVIEIAPVEEDVIYVPYYEPETVVVYQPRPVYHYYPRPYPVYYYPYPAGYAFHHGYFWGLTTAFTVGWYTDSLHVFHHSYHGHPYYGHSYWHNYWYRRPTVHVHNNYYYNGRQNYSDDRYYRGDNWRPGPRSTVDLRDQRVTRNRHYPGMADADVPLDNRRSATDSRSSQQQYASRRAGDSNKPPQFRQRTSTVSNQDSAIRPSQSRAGRHSDVAPTAIKPSNSRPAIKFRGRSSGENPATGRIASSTPRQAPHSSQPAPSQPERRATKPSVSPEPARSTEASAPRTRPSGVTRPSTRPSNSSPRQSTRPSNRSTRTSSSSVSRQSVRSSNTGAARPSKPSASATRSRSEPSAKRQSSAASRNRRQQGPGSRLD